jgi:predicted permease
MLDALRQDIRHAARSIARRPLVSAAAVLSLALGIGVNTAIFSVFDRVLMRRLPVPDPDAIVIVTSPGPRPGSNSVSATGGREAVFSYPLFRDLERVQSVFSGFAAHHDTGFNLSYRGQALGGAAELVSGGYFTTLLLKPALGRLLDPADDDAARETAIVLSHAYWRGRFGADPKVIGEVVSLNGSPATIVGVAPEGFVGTSMRMPVDVFVPLAAADRLRGTSSTAQNRRDHWLYVFGRLKPGLTALQGQALLQPPFATLIRDVEFPVQQSELRARERDAFLSRTIRLEDGSRGEPTNRQQARIAFVLLFCVAVFVLLIACANVANLLLGRVIDRATEVAVRLSLGASTGRMVQWILTESCLLGVAGAAAALLVARMTIDGVSTLVPVDDRGVLGFEVNSSLLLFAAVSGFGTGGLFGIIPVVHVLRSRGGLKSMGESNRATGSRSASRARGLLATAQIALATSLLAETGLFITSLVNVARADLGIRRDGLVTFAVAPRMNGYTPSRSQAFFAQLEDRLAALPGVTSVSGSTIALLGNGFSRSAVSVEGFEVGEDADVTANYARIGPAYFSTVGIPLLGGREFTRADVGPSPTTAIVNEAFARKFRLGREAVGKRMATGRNRALEIEIVGLVADSAYNSVRDTQAPQFFLPYRQAETGALNFYVRSTANTAALFPAIAAAVKALDPALPVQGLRTMEDQINASASPYRVVTTLSTALASLATLLAGIGLYAVLAYGVAQRGREFGIRMALGARALDVGRLVLAHVARITTVGGIIGGILAIGLARLAQGILFGVTGLDGVVAGAATLVLILVALMAAAVPVRRAARIDPASVLRAE